MRKTIVLVMILAVSLVMTSCFFNKGATKEEIADQTIALFDEELSDINTIAEGMIEDYNEEQERIEEEKKKKEEEKRKKEEEEDPANDDSTADYGSQHSSEEMTKAFIGKWKQQGVIKGDGDIGPTDASGTYVIKKDGTFTFKGRDEDGKKIKDSGKWELNDKNQLIAGDSKLGIDESGYLLKDTGERDGKGKRIRYAFAKV